MSDKPSNIAMPLIIGGALIVSGIAMFYVFAFMTAAQLNGLPAGNQQLASMMLVCAVIVGIVGRFFGQVILRSNHENIASLSDYVGRALISTIVSFSAREAAIVMAAFSVRFGGQVTTGASVAGVILVSMLFDLRFPARLRSEYDGIKALRSSL